MGAKIDAQLRLRKSRLAQAETFVRGNDDIAAHYDRIIANDESDVRCLDEIYEHLTRTAVTS